MASQAAPAFIGFCTMADDWLITLVLALWPQKDKLLTGVHPHGGDGPRDSQT